MLSVRCLFDFFFFQAEDGIRDLTVTGVQTCALPISVRCFVADRGLRKADRRERPIVCLAVSEPVVASDAMLRLEPVVGPLLSEFARDRKSTRLKSSHSQNSYAVFCFKKKKTNTRGQY